MFVDTSLRIVALVAAILPPLILLAYFTVGVKQRLASEQIWEAFAVGSCIAIPLVLIVHLLGLGAFEESNWLYVSIWGAFGTAAIPEEMFKFIAVLGLMFRYGRSLGPKGLFCIAVAVSLGFACLENIFYVFDDDDDRFSPALVRSISAVPGHAFDGVVMGYCLVKARWGRHSVLWYPLALIGPILMHGAYDFFLLVPAAGAAAGEGGLNPYWSLIGFDVVVLAAGGLAYLCLASIGRIRPMEGTYDTLELPEGPLDRCVNGLVDWYGTWLAMSGVCLVGRQGRRQARAV